MEEEYLIQGNCNVAALWQFLLSGKIVFLSWYCGTSSANIAHLHFNFLRNAFPETTQEFLFFQQEWKALMSEDINDTDVSFMKTTANAAEVLSSPAHWDVEEWHRQKNRFSGIFLLHGAILKQEHHCLDVCGINSAHQFPLLLKMRTLHFPRDWLSCKD